MRILNDQLYVALVQYLAQKPYAEVVGLLQGLGRLEEVKENEEDASQPDPDSDSD